MVLADNIHPTSRMYNHHLTNIDAWEDPPFDGRVCAAMIVCDDGEFDELLIKGIAERLLDLRCLSISVWGPNADAAFDVVMDTKLADSRNDDELVMTYDLGAWGAEDVAIHLLMNLNFEDHVFEDLLILYLGESYSREGKLNNAILNEVMEWGILCDNETSVAKSNDDGRTEREGHK